MGGPEPSIVENGPDEAFFTLSDNIVLEELFSDIKDVKGGAKPSLGDDRPSLKLLDNMSDTKHPDFQPTIFSTWDYNLADLDNKTINSIRSAILSSYITWARTVVRHDTDVIFLSHIIMYFCTSVPSALYLFFGNFTYLHAIVHLLVTVWYSGGFTLMMHNHIHNNGVLAKPYAAFDWAFPYILEPLMGHTWDSYYYHHVKAHHVEGNGPDDLSTTIRYQRDSIWCFLQYEARFLLLCWFDLPKYFISKRKYNLAFRVSCTELSSYACLYLVARWQFKPALFVFLLPFTVMRIGLMIGNWGQHALVDDVEPNSDFRSSITLIDVPSNRFCFNDGYHTSHHLNPLRHWRDHPHAFLKAKERYSKEGALVFHNIDYLEITFRVLTKNYMHLAKQLVPIGDQIGMTQVELAEMLRRKTRRFSEEEIKVKFAKK
ncbi:phosphoinositide 3-kinase regulatory subunit 4 [Cadophora sp. MPI-SDFR-AT-0126]|nr:phosphoinositide 3-kinase regulatory subunit 4 [Leotiomycetes sp. MPI-SDFR-AT-0126]